MSNPVYKAFVSRLIVILSRICSRNKETGCFGIDANPLISQKLPAAHFSKITQLKKLYAFQRAVRIIVHSSLIGFRADFSGFYAATVFDIKIHGIPG